MSARGRAAAGRAATGQMAAGRAATGQMAAGRAATTIALALSLALPLSACSPTGGDSSPAPGSSTTRPTETSRGDDPSIPEVTPVLPLPQGAAVLSSVPSAPPAQSCDPLPSLRPDDVPPERAVPEIRKRGRLVVGTDQGSNLFSFRDPVSGKLQGFDIDLAHEIARDILGNPDLVEFRTLTSADRITALAGHQVDLVVRSMSITCTRRDDVTFSAPYFTAHQRVLAVRDSGITGVGDLEGRRVCVATGTTSASRLLAEVKRVTILGVNSWADCLVAVQQGQVDAITTDDAILVGITEQDPYLQIVGPEIASEPYGVGIARSGPGHNSDGLVRQVNRTLERIRSDGTWSRMYSRWLSGLGPSPGMPAPVYAPEGRR